MFVSLIVAWTIECVVYFEILIIKPTLESTDMNISICCYI